MPKHISSALTASLLALAALPAAAQDLTLCGGAGANGQWLGGDQANSDISTSPDYIEQMALVLMRNEFVGLFTVSQPGDYRIEAAARGNGDTVLDVRNAAGDVAASDDDSGGNGASRAETTLEAGTYCVSMRSFDGAPLTGFVRVGRMEHDPLTDGTTPPDISTEPDVAVCDLTTAAPIRLGETVTNPVSSQRFYALQLDDAATITLTAENETLDPVLTLYDDAGNWLAENDDFEGLNSRIDMAAPLAAGQYCIALRGYNEEGQSVTLSVTEYDAAAAQTALYASGDAAPPLDGSYPVTALGELATRLRADATVGADAVWYSLDITESGLVLVEAIAQNQGDPVLSLFDDLGRQIAYNDDSAGTLDAMLTARVQRGTYLVAIKQLDRTTQSIVRVVFERYIPAQP